MAGMMLAIALTFIAAGASQAQQPPAGLQQFLPKVQPAEFFQDADRFGPPQGDPPMVPAYKGNEVIGHVYLNSDFTNAVGYSGKPIHILAGIDPSGVITGLKLVDHKEPIVLVGIPERRVVEAVNGLIGKAMSPVASGQERPPQVDIVSGATVTVLVMGDSIVRSAVRIIRSGRLGGPARAGTAEAPPAMMRKLDREKMDVRDWASLLGDGSIRRLHLTIAEVTEAFAKAGNTAAAQHPEPGAPGNDFIDLYIAPLSVPTIGRSLLGEDGYKRLIERLKPGQRPFSSREMGLIPSRDRAMSGAAFSIA
jgi:NosR/NirI family nitrous oxide reductase transcriptional regulator